MSSRKHKFRKVSPRILRERRLALGLSQRDVAHALGLTETSVTQWESGKHAPSNNNLTALARVLCMPEDELTGERPLSAETLVPARFDLPRFLGHLDALISTAEQVRSDLRSLTKGYQDAKDARMKAKKSGKPKTKRKAKKKKTPTE